jgi:hypothetical protein
MSPGTHWIGGWVDPRTGRDNVEGRKILPLLGLEYQHHYNRFRKKKTEYCVWKVPIY